MCVAYKDFVKLFQDCFCLAHPIHRKIVEILVLEVHEFDVKWLNVVYFITLYVSSC